MDLCSNKPIALLQLLITWSTVSSCPAVHRYRPMARSLTALVHQVTVSSKISMREVERQRSHEMAGV